MLRQAIYNLGEKIRNPEIQAHYRQLNESDSWSIEQLKSLQLQRLRQLLKHARKNSPYYEKKLQDFDLDTFQLSDLKNMPTLDKDTLRENINLIQNKPSEQRMFRSSTSGSTGQSMKFERNMDWDAAARAAQYRGYEWYGVKPWSQNLYFWGFNIKWTQLALVRVLDFLVNRKRVFSYSSASLGKAEQYLEKCDYVEGYSSALFTLAQKYEKQGKAFPNVKLVKGTSEKIFDMYHDPVKNVFGSKMVSEYGSAETGIIAFECPEGSMHIAMENVIVELIDNEIVVTNLFSFSLPIIRYKLGDYIELDEERKCKCGRAHSVIKEVTGRVGKNILGKSNSFPALYLYYVFKNISLEKNLDLGYQASQSIPGRLDLNVIYKGDDGDHVKYMVNKEIEKLFEGELVVYINLCKKVNHKGEKIQAFKSFL